MSHFEEFFAGYLSCALWSSVDDDYDPLDNKFDIDALTQKAKASLKRDCRAFFKANYSLWCDEPNYENSTAGHDFWLTRNHHGAGFWDRGLEHGTELTDRAHEYGSCDLLVHRNRIHVT